MDRRKFGLISVGAIATLGLAACSGGNSAGGVTNLRFPTASTTGTIYPLGGAMANLWNDTVDGVRVSAEASNGGVENLNLLADGNAGITFATAGIAYESYNGEGSFEGRKNPGLRVLAGLYYNPNQLVVRKGAGISTPADIAGKRFAPGATGSTQEVESSVILPEYGVDYPDGFRANFVGFTEAIDLMRNRQIDGALMQAGIPTSAVTEIITTADGELIPIEGEHRDALLNKYPWYSPFTIPSGTYDGQEKDVDTIAIKMLLLTQDSVDEELAYNLAKSFWENLDRLSGQNIVSQIKREEATTELAGIPLHPGAERYYNEF